jgi:hypothetical protein
MLSVLRVAWAAPWSLVGLLFAPFFRSRRRTRGVLLCEGAGWPARLGWNYRAITFGHVILCIDEADEALLDHEIVHVRQYERWGPLFIPAYILASVGAKARGGRAYADNPFEVAARSSAEAAGRRLSEG